MCNQSEVKLPRRTMIHLLFIFLINSFLIQAAYANLNDGFWVATKDINIDLIVQAKLEELEQRTKALPMSGGTFWHVFTASVTNESPLVIAFENTSVIGRFTHFIVNKDKVIVAQYEGGIQSNETNRYFLRHGRDLLVPDGDYLIVTRIQSPFLLAQPKPRLFKQADYIKSIKLGNMITLLGLGVFLSLGVYYLALGITRRQPTDYLYSIFIIGNLTYNASALNVLSDVLGLRCFYTISLPIMASNLAYIGFVMALLGITKRRTPKLYKAGVYLILALASLWLIVPFYPQLSLEFARYGVGTFALYGITCGVIMAIKGLKTARYYLIANVSFLIPGVLSIVLQSLPNSTLYIEHLGLFAVALEVILLSLVLSYQLSVVYKEKSANLIAAQESLVIADNAVRTKERFLANISHELRTPLNAIQGSIDLIRSKNIMPEAKENIEIIRHSSSFLLFLINDILDLAKLDAEMLMIDKRTFNLRNMVTQICSIYGSSFTVNSKATFELIIDDSIPAYVYGDEKRIEQVIANLLSNAFKFTESGSVVFSLKAVDDNKHLKFSVKDSGIGIAPENLESMFSAFTQADSSISRKYGGTGLGLKIASKIVELMGGEISATSQLGLGSEFWFTIPLVESKKEDVTEQDYDYSKQDLSFKGLRILVVDDNDVNLKVISALLNRLETEVFAFNLASKAIDFALTEQVDLVIMDIQMPEIDGLTATQTLRNEGVEIPIIAFTANASEKDQLACFEAGMDDILVKPIKLEKLSDTLRKWRNRT